MGFLLAGMGVAMLFGSVVLFAYVFGDDWTGLYEAITGFGLGGSAIALFGRCVPPPLCFLACDEDPAPCFPRGGPARPVPRGSADGGRRGGIYSWAGRLGTV